MKKLFSVFILASVLLTLGFVAAEGGTSECTSQTIVGGTIYQEDITNPIANANVVVTCNTATKEVTSKADGSYSVVFDCTECDYGNSVEVTATKGTLEGTESGEVNMKYNLLCGVDLNVGIVNVPLVPEFGIVVGVVTALGALGVFFVVRKK
ncbi:MAG TPA: hypothetical protein PLY44_03645 [Candidatus Pacearchaeota archaeon]|jgi:hypothetical protein|nr:hypothetical protein [Candidatus Pacearchaeota archaeon]